jgi:hypothetical protein
MPLTQASGDPSPHGRRPPRQQAQISLIGMRDGNFNETALAIHIGGSRAATVTSDRHAARLVFQSASEPIDAPMSVNGSDDVLVL